MPWAFEKVRATITDGSSLASGIAVLMAVPCA